MTTDIIKSQPSTIALPPNSPSQQAIQAASGAAPTLQPADTEIRINWLHGTPEAFPPCWYTNAGLAEAPHGWKEILHPTSGAAIYARREIVVTVLAARQYWYMLPNDKNAAAIILPSYRAGAKKTLQLRCWCDDFTDGLITISLSKVTKTKPLLADLHVAQAQIAASFGGVVPLYVAQMRLGALLDERGKPRWEKLEKGAIVCSPRLLRIEAWHNADQIAFFRQVADDLAATWVSAITGGEPVEGVVVSEPPAQSSADDEELPF